MKKIDKRDIIKILVFIIFMICFIGGCVLFAHALDDERNARVERDGYAVISLDGYTDTIYFTEKYLNGCVYTFILHDGREVRCHKDNVVIYYDEDKE